MIIKQKINKKCLFPFSNLGDWSSQIDYTIFYFLVHNTCIKKYLIKLSYEVLFSYLMSLTLLRNSHIITYK